LRGRAGWAIFKKKKFCTAKTAEKKSCKESHGQKLEQVLSTITILIFHVKKYSCTIYYPPKTATTTSSFICLTINSYSVAKAFVKLKQ